MKYKVAWLICTVSFLFLFLSHGNLDFATPVHITNSTGFFFFFHFCFPGQNVLTWIGFYVDFFVPADLFVSLFLRLLSE